MNFVHDKNESGFDGEFDNVWKKTIVIMKDGCIISTTTQSNPFVNFQNMPTRTEPDELGQDHEFVLMQGVHSTTQQNQQLRGTDTLEMRTVVGDKTSKRTKLAKLRRHLPVKCILRNKKFDKK